MKPGAPKRLLEVGKHIGFATCILIPVELIRGFSMPIVIIPLLLFMGGEYVITDATHTSSKMSRVARNLFETGGKQTLQNIVDKYHILGFNNLYGEY